MAMFGKLRASGCRQSNVRKSLLEAGCSHGKVEAGSMCRLLKLALKKMLSLHFRGEGHPSQRTATLSVTAAPTKTTLRVAAASWANRPELRSRLVAHSSTPPAK